MLTRDEIYSKVATVISEALDLDEEEIKLTSTLYGDLGAESIDFLDIIFRLQLAFEIRIPRQELFPESIFCGDPKYIQDGKVTLEGFVKLQARLPFADISILKENPDVNNIGNLFTVDFIVRYIRSKLRKHSP